MADFHFDVPDVVRDALGWIGGGLLAVSLLPQIVQLVRTRSAEDMSLWFGIIYFLGNALTVVYMILVGALATWIPVVIEIVLCIVTMILKLVYEHTDWGKEQQQQLQQKQLQQWQLQLTEASKSSFCHPATIELLKSFSVLEHPDPFTKCHKQGDGHAAGAFVSGFSLNHLASKHLNSKHAASGSPYLADEDSSHTSQSGAMMAATISPLVRSAASAPNMLYNQPLQHSLWQLSSAGGSNHQSAAGWCSSQAAAAAGFVTAGWPKGFESKLPWYCQAGISHVRSVTPKHAAMQLCCHCGAVRPVAVGTRGAGSSVWFSAPGSSAAATVAKAAGYKISSNPLFRVISGRHSMVEELPTHADEEAAAAADLAAQAATAAAAVATSSTGSASVLEATRLSDLELASGSGTTAASSSAAAPAPAILLSAADGLRTQIEAVTAEAGGTNVDLGSNSGATAAAAAQTTPALSRLSRMNHRPLRPC